MLCSAPCQTLTAVLGGGRQPAAVGALHSFPSAQAKAHQRRREGTKTWVSKTDDYSARLRALGGVTELLARYDIVVGFAGRQHLAAIQGVAVCMQCWHDDTTVSEEDLFVWVSLWHNGGTCSVHMAASISTRAALRPMPSRGCNIRSNDTQSPGLPWFTIL